MKYIKEYKTFIILMFIISISGMCIGSFYDYEIDMYLFNEHNIFSIVIEAVGFYPLYLSIPVLCSLLSTKYNKKSINVIGHIIGILSLFIMIVSGLMFLRERNIYIITYNISLAMAFFISIITYTVINKCIKKTSNEVQRKIFIICCAGVFLVLWKTIIINIIKRFIGRARFYNIIKGIGYYTPWYVINRPRMGTSFPSGHTGGGCGVMLLLLLPLFFNSKKKYKIPYQIIAFIYIFIVAFSRMILGKHMLSDVSAAVLIMTLGFTVLLYGLKNFNKFYH